MKDMSNTVIKQMQLLIDLRDATPVATRKHLSYHGFGRGSMDIRKYGRLLEVSVNDTDITGVFPDSVDITLTFCDALGKPRPWIERFMRMYQTYWGQFGISKNTSAPYLMLDFPFSHNNLLDHYDTCVIHGRDITGGDLGGITKQPVTLQQFVKGPHSLVVGHISFFNVYGDDSGGGKRKPKPTLQSLMSTYQSSSFVLN